MDYVVTRPKSIQDVPSLVKDIQQASIALSTSKEGIDESSRKTTLSLAKELVAALENPEDVVMRYVFELVTQCTSLRLGIDLRIFQILIEHEGIPVSASQLAELSKAELLLVGRHQISTLSGHSIDHVLTISRNAFLSVRIMRVITSIGFAIELDEQVYMATPLTKAINKPALEAGMKVCYDHTTPTFLKMLEHFRVHGYKCPTDSSNCPYSWAYATNLPYFLHMEQYPERQRDFQEFMTGIRAARKYWIDWFPVESELLSATTTDENDTLLVDVGGGKGHDLERFLRQYPQTKGRLVLQDLPSAINTIQQLSSGIHPIAHDFFTPQPVKGARAYYMHFIFHDWPDAECRSILQNLKTAMKAGYSKILLDEVILPQTDCGSWFAACDINMMALLGGKERTQKQWIDLLQSVDLDVKIWNSPHDGEEAIIEAMLKS